MTNSIELATMSRTARNQTRQIGRNGGRLAAGAATLLATVGPAWALKTSNLFEQAERQLADPELSFILVLTLGLIGAVVAFVVVPYMWERSNSTRSLWQSLCRLERENSRLRDRVDSLLTAAHRRVQSIRRASSGASEDESQHLGQGLHAIAESLNEWSRKLRDPSLGFNRAELADMLHSHAQDAGSLASEFQEWESRQSIPADGHVRLLIVDDDEMNRARVADSLAQVGYEVETATDGAQALEMLTHQRFDLVIMDLDLPIMDGFESAQRIRSGEICPDIPIVALAAEENREDAARCLAMGMNDYLTKPCDMNTLESKLRRWLPGASS